MHGFTAHKRHGGLVRYHLHWVREVELVWHLGFTGLPMGIRFLLSVQIDTVHFVGKIHLFVGAAEDNDDVGILV